MGYECRICHGMYDPGELVGGVCRECISDEHLIGNHGYKEMGSGIFVADKDAFSYAMERVSQNEDLEQEFRDMVVEWFYSGNWIREE